MVLGIETSCDETAAALVTQEGDIRSSIVASQDELHARFGGVVPEVASRRHLELVVPVVREALTSAGDYSPLEPVRAAFRVGRDDDLVGPEGADRVLDRLQRVGVADLAARLDAVRT